MVESSKVEWRAPQVRALGAYRAPRKTANRALPTKEQISVLLLRGHVLIESPKIRGGPEWTSVVADISVPIRVLSLGPELDEALTSRAN